MEGEEATAVIVIDTVTGQLIERQTVRVNVTEEEVCRYCKKRIGQSVFCRYPNGHLVHFSCFNKSKETSS